MSAFTFHERKKDRHTAVVQCHADVDVRAECSANMRKCCFDRIVCPELCQPLNKLNIELLKRVPYSVNLDDRPERILRESRNRGEEVASGT